MSNTTLRILPLGGLGEIGRNMTVFESGRDLLVVDCGVMFPGSDLPGIDLVLPDYGYVVERRKSLRGIVITHAHLDHIGALPYLLRALDRPVPIYASALTLGMIRADLEEAGVPIPPLHELDAQGAGVSLGAFRVNAFHVTHSIPGALGLVIDTPAGRVVHTGDYKLDPTPVSGTPTDLARLRQLTRGGVLALLGDSTNADRPGRTPSERTVAEALRVAIAAAPGRVIIATFSSQVDRIQQIIDLAAQARRKVTLAGRSMIKTTGVARKLGYLRVPDGVLVDIEQSAGIPDRQLVILATGSQGEPTAALARMAAGENPHVTVRKGDTVILSSHAIPGNEELVGRVVNQLFERGANVLYDRLAAVHVSGHASRDEQREMLELVKPRYLLPVHGESRHQHLHAQLAQASGLPAERILLLANGRPWECDVRGHARLGTAVPLRRMLVDGASVGEIGQPVIRDRERLAEEGFVVVLLPVDAQGRLKGEPTLISRGFVHLEESGELLAQARTEVKRLLRGKRGGDQAAVVGQGLSRFLYRTTQRNPMVLPRIVQG
jgi:ribonuclease J